MYEGRGDDSDISDGSLLVFDDGFGGHEIMECRPEPGGGKDQQRRAQRIGIGAERALQTSRSAMPTPCGATMRLNTLAMRSAMALNIARIFGGAEILAEREGGADVEIDARDEQPQRDRSRAVRLWV